MVPDGYLSGKMQLKMSQDMDGQKIISLLSPKKMWQICRDPEKLLPRSIIKLKIKSNHYTVFGRNPIRIHSARKKNSPKSESTPFFWYFLVNSTLNIHHSLALPSPSIFFA